MQSGSLQPKPMAAHTTLLEGWRGWTCLHRAGENLRLGQSRDSDPGSSLSPGPWPSLYKAYLTQENPAPLVVGAMFPAHCRCSSKAPQRVAWVPKWLSPAWGERMRVDAWTHLQPKFVEEEVDKIFDAAEQVPV